MAGSGDAVGSTKFIDYQANAEVFDQLVNGSTDTVVTRETPTNPSGKVITSLQGYQSAFDDAVAQINADVATVESAKDSAITQIDSLVENGQSEIDAKVNALGWVYKDPDTFETGSTLTENYEALLWAEADGGNGEYYRWTGALPKVVPASSTPATSGGFAEGAWKATGYAALKQELASSDPDKGALLVKRVTVNVETAADAVSLPASIGTIVETKGEVTVTDGGWKRYEVVAAGTGSNTTLFVPMNNGNQLRLIAGNIISDFTVSVPTDFNSVQEAFDSLSVLTPARQAAFTVNMESGYQIPEGVRLQRSGVYNHITLTSDDPIVYLTSAFPSGDILFLFGSCTAPRISCLIDMEGKGTNGVGLTRGATGYIEENCGIIAAGQTGAYIQGTSNLYANGAVLRDCYGRNVECTDASSASLQVADLRNGNRDGVYFGANYARRASTINAQGADFSDTAGIAVAAHRSARVNAKDGVFNNVTGDAAFAQSGGIVIVDNAVMDNVNSVARAETGGKFTANGVTATNVLANGFRVDSGSSGVANEFDISGATGNTSAAIFTTEGGDFRGANATASDFDLPILAGFASQVRLTNSDISAGFSNRSSVSNGAQLWVHGSTTENSASAGVPDVTDFNVSAFNQIFGGLGGAAVFSNT